MADFVLWTLDYLICSFYLHGWICKLCICFLEALDFGLLESNKKLH
jgi:hypothetical protein